MLDAEFIAREHGRGISISALTNQYWSDYKRENNGYITKLEAQAFVEKAIYDNYMMELKRYKS